MVNDAIKLKEQLDRAVAFAIIEHYHVWMDDTEIAYFKCPKCSTEWSFDKASDETHALGILYEHMASHAN